MTSNVDRHITWMAQNADKLKSAFSLSAPKGAAFAAVLAGHNGLADLPDRPEFNTVVFQSNVAFLLNGIIQTGYDPEAIKVAQSMQIELGQTLIASLGLDISKFAEMSSVDLVGGAANSDVTISGYKQPSFAEMALPGSNNFAIELETKEKIMALSASGPMMKALDAAVNKYALGDKERKRKELGLQLAA